MAQQGDGRLIAIDVTPTITAGAYTTGKALGGLLTFTAPTRYQGAKLKQIVITDKANQKIAIDLLLFNQTFTPTADAATIAISLADLLNMVGHVSLVAGDYITVGTGAVATKIPSSEFSVCTSGQNDLFGQLVIRGSATYASTTDIQVRLVFERLS